MMTDKPTTPSAADADTISFADLGGGVIVIRIDGRGSFANSVEFQQLVDHLTERFASEEYRLIVDLDKVSTLDSTFMGTLAGTGLRHRRDTGQLLVLCNVNDQCGRLLDTVGIKHFVDVRTHPPEAPGLSGADFQVADKSEVSRTDRIVHMIEAHQNLMDLDDDNAARFESVLKYLNESLDREKKK